MSEIRETSGVHYDYIDFRGHQVGCQGGKLITFSDRVPNLKANVSPLRPPQFLQRLAKSSEALRPLRIGRSQPPQNANFPLSVWRLSNHRERPGNCWAAQKCNELAPPHVSTPMAARGDGRQDISSQSSSHGNAAPQRAQRPTAVMGHVLTCRRRGE